MPSDFSPESLDRFLLSVKGGITPEFKPNASIEFLREECEKINKILKHRKMDMYEVARVDKEAGIENVSSGQPSRACSLRLIVARHYASTSQIMRNLLTLRDEGHFKHISLSECSADTIRKAAAVGPVSTVEVEYSPFATDIERNGVLAACKELNIPIAAYS